MSQAVLEIPPSPNDIEAADLSETGSTTFVFINPVFKAPGARFIAQGTAREPAFGVDLGDTKGLLAIAALKRQFNIAPGSADDRAIALAVRSLNYVNEIRPGDNIPNEILTGKASWTIDPRHTEIARRRLELQLLASVDGKAATPNDTKDITAYLGQAENKAKLRTAFSTAAQALGRAPDDHTFVLTQLAAFSRELAYIEALREWFLQVGSLNKKVPLVAAAFDGDKRLKGEIVQMQALLRHGIQEYRTLFMAVDAESSDVVGALTAIDKKVAAVREGRDKLHNLTLVWKDSVAAWKGFTKERAAGFLDATQATYRLLASRYSIGRSLLGNGREKQAMMKSIAVKSS